MQQSLPIYTLGPENFIAIVHLEDDLLHTNERPWCNDLSCLCHQDADLLREYAAKPIEHGLLTVREAQRLWLG